MLLKHIVHRRYVNRLVSLYNTNYYFLHLWMSERRQSLKSRFLNLNNQCDISALATASCYCDCILMRLLHA